MLKEKLKPFALVLIATLSLTACGSSASQATPTPSGSPASPAVTAADAAASPAAASPVAASSDKKNEGSIKVGITADPDTLNPVVSKDRAGQWLGSLTYATLLKRDEKGIPQPYLAESYTVSPDGKKVTFKLRKDLKWSDGAPLTSADVAYTKYLSADLKLSNNASSFDLVESVDTPDDQTVIFNLKAPSYAFVGSVGPWMRIVPKHVWEKIKDPKTFQNDTNQVGLGPFVLKEAKRGQYYTYTRVDQWPLYPDGKPYMKEITFRIYPDINAMVLAVQSGEVDMTAKEIPIDAANQLKAAGFEVEQNTSLGYSHVSFNLKNEFLQDVKLRQALATSIDKDTIVKFALKGQGMPMDSIISPVFKDLQGADPKAKYPSYSADNAKKILADAGYKDTDNDGIVNAPNGKNVAFGMIFDGNDIFLKNTAEVLAKNYKDVGVSMTLMPQEKTTYSANFQSGKFDAVLGNWGIMEVLNGDMNVVYNSTSPMNYYGQSFKDIDDSLAKIQSSTSIDQCKVGIQDFEVAMASDCISIPLYVQKFSYPHSSKYGGFLVFPSDLCGIIDPQSMAQVYAK